MRKLWKFRGEFVVVVLASLLSWLALDDIMLRAHWNLTLVEELALIALGAVVLFLLVDKLLFVWAACKFELYVYHGIHNGSQVTFTKVGGANVIVPSGQELLVRESTPGVVEIGMREITPEPPSEDDDEL